MTMTTTPTPHAAMPAGRLFMAVGFVCTSIFAAILTTGGSVYVASYTASQTEKISEVSAFVKSTQEFDPLFKAYMDTVLDGKGDMVAARKAVEENLHKQHILLGAADDYLTGEDHKEAERYRNKLVIISKGLRTKTRDPLTGHDLMQGVADATAIRERVIASLRREAGLKS